MIRPLPLEILGAAENVLPPLFPKRKPFDLRANIVAALIGGLGGLSAVLAIGIAVGLYTHGLPWLRSLFAIFI